MRLLGTVIPFIGFKRVEVDAYIRRMLDLGPEHTTINTFQLAWLGYAIVLPIDPRDE